MFDHSQQPHARGLLHVGVGALDVVAADLFKQIGISAIFTFKVTKVEYLKSGNPG